jgi:hypothetical protein
MPRRSRLDTPYELDPLSTSTSTLPPENIMEHYSEDVRGYDDQRQQLLDDSSSTVTVTMDEKKGKTSLCSPVDVLRFPILQALP